MSVKHFAIAAAASFACLALLAPLPAPAAQEEPVMQTEGSDDGHGASAETAGAGPATISEGAALFVQQCKGCHAAEPGQPSYGGPSLAGVVGREAASGEYRYSPALKNSGLTWTREELDAYLAAPTTKVPGTTMVTSLRDPEQRHAVIEFLASTAASEESAP
jgi:cytochrome c